MTRPVRALTGRTCKRIERIELWCESHAEGAASRRRIATFAHTTHAQAAAVQRLDAQLLEFHRPGQSAEQLVQLWLLFGDDCFLVPAAAAGESAVEHVRRRALRMTRS